MPKTEKGLMDLMVDRAFLEQAATDAEHAVKNKRAWYLLDFIAKRDDYMDEIQNMVILGYYPKKEYMEREINNMGKKRVIDTLPFYPWSILLHAIKNALEPIVQRVLIQDSSAGAKGKGQVFASLRTKMFLRRYRKYTHIGVSDCRKYYQSIPHWLVRKMLKRYVKDDLFMQMIEEVILDYHSDIEDMLQEERERKLRYCRWADNEVPFVHEEERGVTIGGSVSQLIGNLCLSSVDYLIKRKMRIKVYHRHCDDIIFGARSQAEGEAILTALDHELGRLGMCMKASSLVAPIKDEKKEIKGRALSYCGYIHSRRNMRVRKRTKQRFARKLKRVKSKRRRREIIAAYWGIAKWGKCRHLWRTILRQSGIMSFADVGIKTEKIRMGSDGKRMFDVPLEKIGTLADCKADIIIHDFEDNITVKDGSGRCVVLFQHVNSPEEDLRKFVTTSIHIIEKLRQARVMEDEGKKIFPQPTRIICQRMGNGRMTYDIE